MRIFVECTDQEVIESAVSTIIDSLRASGNSPKGPVLLPVSVDLYVVRRCGRKEKFEVRTHRRMVKLDGPSAKTMAYLVPLGLPAGVEIKVLDG